MSKGSTRRKEDSQKVHDNWDAIFGKKEAKTLLDQFRAEIEAIPDGPIECKHTTACANPFCNCEVKHDAK